MSLRSLKLSEAKFNLNELIYEKLCVIQAKKQEINIFPSLYSLYGIIGIILENVTFNALRRNRLFASLLGLFIGHTRL